LSYIISNCLISPREYVNSHFHNNKWMTSLLARTYILVCIGEGWPVGEHYILLLLLTCIFLIWTAYSYSLPIFYACSNQFLKYSLWSSTNTTSFFKDFIYLFKREHEQRQRESRGRSRPLLSREPDAGLHPRTLRSWPEPKADA